MPSQALSGERTQPRNKKPRNMISSPAGATMTVANHIDGSQPSAAALV